MERIKVSHLCLSMILPRAGLHYALYRLSLESMHSPRGGRACPGHPRLWSCSAFKTWMPATSAGMTSRESCVLVLSGITVFPLGFVALPRPRHRGETLLEIGDQIINIFEPD